MRYFEEPDSTLDNSKFPCGKCNLNIRKTTRPSNVIHVIFGPISNVMELMPNIMKALKKLRNLTFVKYAWKISLHYSIISDEQYIAFEKSIDKS